MKDKSYLLCDACREYIREAGYMVVEMPDETPRLAVCAQCAATGCKTARACRLATVAAHRTREGAAQ